MYKIGKSIELAVLLLWGCEEMKMWIEGGMTNMFRVDSAGGCATL